MEVVNRLGVPIVRSPAPRPEPASEEYLPSTSSDLPDEKGRLQKAIQEARERLVVYEKQLQFTLDRRRDPDQGYTELGIIEKLHQYFDELEKAITIQPEVGPSSGILVEKSQVKAAIGRLGD